MNRLHNLIDRLFEDLEKRFGIQADPQRHDDQWHKRKNFARREIVQLFILGIRHGTEEDPLIEPEQISRRQNHARSRPSRPPPVRGKCSLQNRELADKSIQQRQSHRREKHDHRDRRVNRHHIRDAAILRDLTRVPPFIQDADNQEQRAGRDAVIDLLQHRSAEAHRIQRENSQCAEAQVADGRGRHQFFHVFLHQRNQRAIDDSNQRDPDHPALHFGMRHNRGKERQREAHESTRSHLEQNARQNDGSGGGRFHVCIRQPRVERKHRNLDRKSDKESDEEPDGVMEWNQWRCLIKLWNAECENAINRVVMEIQEQDAKQHQHRAKQRVEKELDRRIEFARTAPDANQQIHRHQHRFPENEEKEKIERHEDAEHPRLQHQEPDVIFLHPYLDGGPRRKNRDPSEQRGQHDQQNRDAVNAEVVTRANRGDPVVRSALEELEAGLETLRPEHRHQRQRDQESAEREDVRDPANRIFALLGDEQENERAHERREEDNRQYVTLHKRS